MSHHANTELLEQIYEALIDEGYDHDEAWELAYKEFEKLPEADDDNESPQEDV